jgi:hypothetical protein
MSFSEGANIDKYLLFINKYLKIIKKILWAFNFSG